MFLIFLAWDWLVNSEYWETHQPKKAYCWCFRNPGCFLKPSGECWDKPWIEMDKLLYTISSWTGRGHQQDMSYDLFFRQDASYALEWFLEAPLFFHGFSTIFSPNSGVSLTSSLSTKNQIPPPNWSKSKSFAAIFDTSCRVRSQKSRLFEDWVQGSVSEEFLEKFQRPFPKMDPSWIDLFVSKI